ncbi:MAG: hypothetical protein ACI9YH_000058 [Colwellia sp.]|jgi:hypothetical protein
MLNSCNPPFFIFGAQKSGTTLLTTLLTQNEGIRIATDSVFINIFISWIFDKAVELSINGNPDNIYVHGGNIRIDVLDQTPSYDDVKWLVSQMYHRYFTTSTQRLQKLISMNKDINRESFIRSEELIPFEHGQTLDPCELFFLAKSGTKWSDIFNNVIMQIGDKASNNEAINQNIIYGEKTPGHIRYTSFINKAYPDAKFIFLLRNPIANIASYYKRDNSGFGVGHKHNFLEALKTFESYIIPFINHYKEQPERFHIIKYEDLVANPSETIEKVSHILGKTYKPINRTLSPTVKQSYVGNHIDLERASSAYNILSIEQEAIIKERFGYIFSTFYKF